MSTNTTWLKSYPHPENMLRAIRRDGREYFKPTGGPHFKNGPSNTFWGAAGSIGESGPDKTKSGHVAAQLIHCDSKSNSQEPPYVGFSTKIPRDKNQTLTYGRGGATDFHIFEMRFPCSAVTLSFKKVSPGAKDLRALLGTYQDLEITESVVVARFIPISNKFADSPYSIGHDWSNVPLKQEGRDILETTRNCQTASSWSLFLPYSEELESKLYGYGEMFALMCFGKDLNYVK
ncbi:hypothetical protein BKA64DRAFT_700302 [Cadophora sp. MPI-SDFR-AT-0126]|nr:hypothetical protein BKA64DRAFT_700302 [Leotiomycetes sp. MPI-SDFR-AT-0126]